MKEMMTRAAASRIQSAACKAGEGTVKAGSFAARAMSAAYKNEPISQPMSAATGLPQPLVKGGFVAMAALGGAYSAYKHSESIFDVASSAYETSKEALSTASTYSMTEMAQTAYNHKGAIATVGISPSG